MPDGYTANARSSSSASPATRLANDSRPKPVKPGTKRIDSSAPVLLSSDGTVLDDILNNPNLPSPPSIALQIVELASDFDADIKDVVGILKVDPSICAKILKTVNSCIYGLRKPVVSIERAVSIVGFHPLRSLVLGLAIPSLQGKGESESGLRSFWRESVSGAMMARELAIRLRDPQAEEIFLAGLLRDLGMTLLRQKFQADYDPVWCISHERWTELWGKKQCEWEKETLGIDHAELSAALLTRWHLPEEIIQPVRHHHDPDQTKGMDPRIHTRTKILDFCGRMARIENVAEDADALQEVIDVARVEYGMSIADLENFLADVCPKIEAFAEILDIEIESVSHFAEAMAAGCAELARLSVALSFSHPMQGEAGGQPETQSLDPHSDLEANPSGSLAIQQTYSLDFLDQLGKPEFDFSIQQYHIEAILGRGGMGVVLKAFEPGLDRFVALKMISPHLAESPRIRDRFAHEARTAASILHENVVTIFTIGKYRGVSFLVMECVDGLSIQEHFKRGRRFRLPEILRIGEDCAKGLVAAHRLGIIHRDIKPGNILLRRQEDRVQLTDFGLACVVREASLASANETVWGTPEYMSPEQAEGGKLTCSTDLYSLGGAMFALCTGSHPLPWSARREMPSYSIPKAIRRVNPTLPDELIRVIAKLLSPEATDRYSSAEEVSNVLAAVGKKLG